jgi:hypothetical protein
MTIIAIQHAGSPKVGELLCSKPSPSRDFRSSQQRTSPLTTLGKVTSGQPATGPPVIEEFRYALCKVHAPRRPSQSPPCR